MDKQNTLPEANSRLAAAVAASTKQRVSAPCIHNFVTELETFKTCACQIIQKVKAENVSPRFREEEWPTESVLSVVRLRKNLYVVLDAVSHILRERHRGADFDARRESIAALSTILAAYCSGVLKIDSSGHISLPQPARQHAFRYLLPLCSITPNDMLRRLPPSAKVALLMLLADVRSISFQHVIEILWPASMHFVPQAPDSDSAVYRKTQGAYMTPRWLARRTVEYALTSYLRQKGVAASAVEKLSGGKGGSLPPDLRRRLNLLLREIRLVDCACGVGSFLSQAFHLILSWRMSLVARPDTSEYVRHLLETQLHGVDRDPLAVALTRVVLSLEASSYLEETPPKPLVYCGDALTGRPFHGTWDAAPPPRPSTPAQDGLDWPTVFPQVARAGGFDLVIGNPPWERVKLLSREFFEVTEPSIAAAPTTAARRRRMNDHRQEEFEQKRAEHIGYAQAIRLSNYFQYTAGGDLNLYPLFIERAMQIANEQGSIGLIVPSGLATDYGMSRFFNKIREDRHLQFFLDFENRAKIFPDVDGRFRFSICVLTNAKSAPRPKYAFFLHNESDLDDATRKLDIAESKIALVNPNTRTVPVVRSKTDLRILLDIHSRIPVLDPDDSGRERTWNLDYRRFFDMTNDSDKFHPWLDMYPTANLRPDGFLKTDEGLFARVYEGRMIDLFDHRAASCVESEVNYRRPAASVSFSESDRKNPEHLASPRYAVDNEVLEQRLRGWKHQWFIGFMDIGSATNRRTMITSVLPKCAAGNKVPLLLPQGGAKAAALLLANLGSFVFDYSLRQHVGNITLNWFILRQCPVLPSSAFERSYVGNERLDEWIQSRILKLTYTSTDLGGWANELGHDGEPFIWDSVQRRQLRVELDAMFFALYGLEEEEVTHVMDTFPIIRKLDEAQYGSYRLKDEIVEKWREIQPQVSCSW